MIVRIMGIDDRECAGLMSNSDVKIRNMEQSPSGKSLTSEQKAVNNKFRGDQFKSKDSFSASIPEKERAELVNINKKCTCIFEGNLDGDLKNNDEFISRFNDDEKKIKQKLNETRQIVPSVTEDTIMQKVIPDETFRKYIGKEPMDAGKKVGLAGCVSRAEDAAPFTSNPEAFYKNLRLDYKGTPYKEKAEKKGSVYVIRGTCGYTPTNDDYPKVDKDNWWNNPPCTGQGFAGADDELIPEYTYGPEGYPMNEGAIFMIDSQGNEYLAAVWNPRTEKFKGVL